MAFPVIRRKTLFFLSMVVMCLCAFSFGPHFFFSSDTRLNYKNTLQNVLGKFTNTNANTLTRGDHHDHDNDNGDFPDSTKKATSRTITRTRLQLVLFMQTQVAHFAELIRIRTHNFSGLSYDIQIETKTSDHKNNGPIARTPALRTLVWQSTSCGGYGNALSCYWLARAIAYICGYAFEAKGNAYLLFQQDFAFGSHLPISVAARGDPIVHLQREDRQYAYAYAYAMNGSALHHSSSSSSFSLFYFTPAYLQLMSYLLTPSTNTGTQETEIETVVGREWNTYCNHWPHECALWFLLCNRVFAPIVAQDSRHAMAQWYAHAHHHPPAHAFNGHGNGTVLNVNVVLYIRCGDLLLDPRRFVMTNQYFKFALRRFYESIHTSTSTSTTADTRFTVSVWIISQISKGTLHNSGDRRLLGFCQTMIERIVSQDLNESMTAIILKLNGVADVDVRVNIVGDGTITSDFYRMMSAQLLICSASTFCYHAAVANAKGIVVLPVHGGWVWQRLRNVSKYTYSVDSGVDGDRAMMGDTGLVLQSALLPANHFLINTKHDTARDWMLTTIQMRNMKLLDNVDKMVEYLISH